MATAGEEAMAKRNGNATTKETNKTAVQRRGSEDLGERLAATPFTFMRRFSEEMDRLFGDVGFGADWLAPVLGRAAKLPGGLWSPEVEVVERDNELVLRADLPGLTKDDVKIELSNEGITLEGERKSESKEDGEGYYRSERSYGKFYRRIPLPEGVEVDDATASFNNGVLEITMPAPKREQRKPRKLEISAERKPMAKRKAA
jgi:HSP20 family protein